MVIDDLVKSPGTWSSPDEEAGIVISSRVRLARNIRDAAFAGWAGQEECIRLCRRLSRCCQELPSLTHPVSLDMGALRPVDKEVLKERRLISAELADKGTGSALVVSADERIAIMINEEDHLRLQAMSPGMNLRDVWKQIDRVDTDLEQQLDYAFSPRFGYLTACPSNVGTGLRASVMMHLSGLRLTGDIESVVNGLEKLGLAVRGLLGEGTEAYGNMFQVSNQSTLGEPEEGIIDALIKIVDEVVQHEQNARMRLRESKPRHLEDHVARSVGVLQYARLLSSQEAVDLLSGLRLGVEMGLVAGVTSGQIGEMMLCTQPGHLQRVRNRAVGPVERDEARATLLRERLRGVSLLEIV